PRDTEGRRERPRPARGAYVRLWPFLNQHRPPPAKLPRSRGRGHRRPGRGARAGDRPGGPRARSVREGLGGPSQSRTNARRARGGAVPSEVGTRTGVPAERDATAGTGLPPDRTPDGQGGERIDRSEERRVGKEGRAWR